MPDDNPQMEDQDKEERNNPDDPKGREEKYPHDINLDDYEIPQKIDQEGEEGETQDIVQ